ncbi:neuronal acetylcholine receptor subunit alpha-10 [Colius striatus]|uniref:neuronal acetylcholine receptor subunit alpha-10 n=1 Tax=Colius striatus TaxID=57412 RepID=UPI002B1E4343|nr:neuronal acetylcholine receptor subunit alpha-10 [Colius striatus]
MCWGLQGGEGAALTPTPRVAPLPGKYYIATMTMITASTSLTIFIMNIHHCGAGARPVPPWARRLILQHMARLCRVQDVGDSCRGPRRGAGRGDPGGTPADGEAEGDGGGCPRQRCLCHHRGLLRNVAYISSSLRRRRIAQRRAGDWKKVAKVMDRFFMWVFFLMVFLMSVLVLGKAA